MSIHCPIKPPFFEIGPKAYLWGRKMLELAQKIDCIAARYNVDVILTPQPTDIRLIAENTSHIHIYAQHMDAVTPGRGLGKILPEAVKEAGATGVMLNHAECPLPLSALAKAISRAKELELSTIVCADSIEEACAIAELAPDIIVAEPTSLIGTGHASSLDYVKETIRRIKAVNPEILVLQGAGISCAGDVEAVIYAGAEATGCSSAVFLADDPGKKAEELLLALRRSWDGRWEGASS